ncbi:uncharacterized protein LOC116785568 isoform X1 [Chiroxiphia lanceolata]|uniref:uncharacterized protein LOC116785568 isoform X1 n=1 Tax=Chiroxiphia lanceolata TaxID=296741 RepID=UPI0013CF0247|nr:uncharacterized protein LOC116785568 isoform X1 [Chiroxiphia lanceolata]XP_032541194.1 uncharacterized protein LOC116785568 isoform X1 [Chiroxiphia lanceolata]XP_032541195.1 uncharacterized protein LOC116785568 isoform X1 [Chiroxiphia lanceolata]XP_032541196.1 uncharacterized protein LOC116785568 isoform X1 [Chiroxiphia lanceolata]
MSDTEEEPRDNNGTWPTGAVSSPVWVDMNSELPEEYIQQMRNLSLRSHQQSDSSVLSRDDEDETTTNDMYGTATASEQQVSPEAQTANSDLFSLVHGHQGLFGVQFAWICTQRSCEVNDWFCQPCAAISSAVSASLLPLRLPGLVQPAAENSLTDNIIPFIYEYFCFSAQIQMDFGE